MSPSAPNFTPAQCRCSRFRANAFLLTGFLALGAGTLASVASAKSKWDPIPKEDLAATECKSYPGSSAEVLFLRKTYNTSGKRPMYATDEDLEGFKGEGWCANYVRVKVYSPKGVEEVGVLSIWYGEHESVSNLLARVTKPDGQSTEFGKESFSDAVVTKTEAGRSKRKALAVPNLSAGDIVEMQWSQTVFSQANYYYYWFCQDTVPVREYSFAVEGSSTDYNIFSFNVAKTETKRINSYQARLVMRDLPPYEAEPHMPPEKDVRGWFMLIFSHPYLRWFSKPGEIWKEIGTYHEEDFRLLTRPGQEIKDQAFKLIPGARSDAEKLQRLYDFCQQEIGNASYFDSPELQEEKKRLKDDDKQSPTQTLKRKAGYSHHINELFASLAVAAGFEVRLGLCASRNNTLNVQNPKGWLFVDDDIVLVKIGDRWQPYIPGDYYTPAGMIDQSNEMATYLRCGEDKAVFDVVAVSPAEKSAVTRKGRFRLDAEGNLEGDVEIRMGGHEGMHRKYNWNNKQNSEIDNDYRELVTKRLPGAEISDLAWENLRGNTLPLVVRYKVKVAGYAEVAGSRIVLTPDYFDHGKPAIFSAEQRKYAIFFDHAWAEHDDIEIELPEGYRLEAPSAPANVGNPDGALGARYKLGYKPKRGLLTYQRDFALGANGAIAFQATGYPAVKTLTDAISRSDEHSLVLKPQPAAPAPAATPAAPAPATPPPTAATPETPPPTAPAPEAVPAAPAR